MISNIYQHLVGVRQANVLRSTEFNSLDSLKSRCLQIADPTLVIVPESDIADVLSWIEPRHDVCLATTPETLVQYRLNKLSGPSIDCFDAHTSLLSRLKFHQSIDLLEASNQTDQEFSVLYCDIDHFKRVNDVHGHNEGDRILRELAKLIQQLCNEEDLIARVGGEEFAVLSARDRDSTLGLAERIRIAVQRRFAADVQVTVSLGAGTGKADLIRDVQREADEALFAAKAGGRNRCVHFVDLQSGSQHSADDAWVIGIENRALVLSQRVANLISNKSKKVVARIRSEADTDGLTRFYTRQYLERRLGAEIDGAEESIVIAFVDLDHFGNVNKAFGWPTGDKVLRDVCELIRGELRDSDWVGRYGGEEFCIVMRNTKLADAAGALERLRRAVESASFVSTSGDAVPMTLSIGVIESIPSENYIQTMERASAQALRAKRSGRNRVACELDSAL